MLHAHRLTLWGTREADRDGNNPALKPMELARKASSVQESATSRARVLLVGLDPGFAFAP